MQEPQTPTAQCLCVHLVCIWRAASPAADSHGLFVRHRESGWDFTESARERPLQMGTPMPRENASCGDPLVGLEERAPQLGGSPHWRVAFMMIP